MDDDLNTAEALAAVFEYIREINVIMDRGEFRAGNKESARGVLQLFESVFEVLRPTTTSADLSEQEVEAKIEERRVAKKARNFALSDEIRDFLTGRGIILEDTKDGVRWKRK